MQRIVTVLHNFESTTTMVVWEATGSRGRGKPTADRPQSMLGQAKNESHAPRYPCLHEDCNKHIAGPVRDIKRHMDTHFHPRFWCPQCGERFGRADQLVEHCQGNNTCRVRSRTESLVVDHPTGRFKTSIFADPSHFTVLHSPGRRSCGSQATCSKGVTEPGNSPRYPRPNT
ncbi:hypothetical protein B0H21DRAFT_769519 [Amylocystis lapponica]|nr:hypothetical protein B0H21DRAFT_769519 [Amylocystis lapponica]